MTKVVNRIRQEYGGNENRGYVITGDIADVWVTSDWSTEGSTFLTFLSREKQKELTVDLPAYITDKVETPLLDIEFEVGDIDEAMLESVTYEKVTDTQYKVFVSYTRLNDIDSNFKLKTRVKGVAK